MIYFVRAGTKRLVKIGYSKGHPIQRVKTLQTGSIEPLRLLGMLEGQPKDEAEWHKRFKHLRVTGEWFRWTPELSRAVRPHTFKTKLKQFERSIRETAELCERDGYPFERPTPPTLQELEQGFRRSKRSPEIQSEIDRLNGEDAQ